MVKSLPIIMTNNAEHTGHRIKSYKLIQHGVLIVPLLMTNAYAGGDPTYTFNLPVQPLSATLDSLAQSSHTKLIYADATVKGLRAAPVKGNYTAQQALNIALGNSGLNYKVVDKTLITVTGKPAAASPSSEITLKPMTVVGETVQDPNDPYNPDYNVTNASTATKTDTPIIDTPYSVAVVPQQVLKDQQVVRVDKALQNVAGVSIQPGNGLNADAFMIRGFANDTLYRNGFLLPSALGGGTSKRETANLQRIEVLKGPGSILFGRTEPGGIINLVTKTPQAMPYHSLQQQFGSYDFYRTTADSTGAITDDNKLLYRVNLAYENSGSFRQFQQAEREFIAPSFTWNITDQTQATFDVEYQHFDETSDSGQPPIMKNLPLGNEPVSNRPAPIPRDREVGEYTNNKNRGNREYVGFNWSHAFNDDWKITQRFGAEFWDIDSLYLFFYPGADAEGNLSRSFNNGKTQQQEYYTTLNLTGKFDTGMLNHTVLMGFDYFVIDNQGTGNCCTSAPDFNVFNPTYMTTAPELDPANNYKNDITQDWYGLYIQDQVKLPYNVFANFGLRYDSATSQNNLNTATTANDHVSPRGGLLWRPVEWLSMYGSYSENFGQNNSLFRSPDQKPLAPQTAQQWEMGTKTEFFDGRLSGTFAYFDLTKQNVAVTDPQDPLLQKTIGEQESRGYEFEATGEILSGWNVIGAYTHLAYANINKDVGFDGGSGYTGHRMYMTPRNFGSLWNTYEFLAGDLRGLKFGAGVVAASQSQGDFANDYQIPGYATVNLLTSYALKVGKSKVTLQLNLDNLLDKTYYSGSNTAYQIAVGTPRTFLGSVKVEF